MSQHWYAVYTRPKWEKKVADILSRKKIENYCPQNKLSKNGSDRKKAVMQPLFTSYVFVRATLPELESIRLVDGVVNLVHWLGSPAIIKNVEIETLRHFLSEHNTIQLEQVPVDMKGMVRIIREPMSERNSNAVNVQAETIKLILPTLGYQLSAVQELSSIRVFTPQETAGAKRAVQYSFR